jgi:hypothetical protein
MNPYRPVILSPEGSAEVEEELKNGSPMTPERQAMFERMDRRAELRKRWAEREQDLHCPDEPIIRPNGGLREILDEIENGSPMTPERAATFEQMENNPMDPYRRTPPLSIKGSREVEEEMARPPADTPERRSLFERVRVRAAMRRRVAEAESTAPKI